MTINQAMKLDQYPIPKIEEDLLASLAGGGGGESFINWTSVRHTYNYHWVENLRS